MADLFSRSARELRLREASCARLTSGDGSHTEYIEPGSRWLVTVALDGTDVRSFDAVHPEGPIAWAPIP